MNKFFVESENISGDKIFITDKEDVHHISKVLRIRQGEKLEISDYYRKKDYLVEMEKIDANCVVCNILEEIEENREPKVSITLFQGIPKQGKMELIIQKTVELGIAEIVPCVMKRSINSDASKVGKKIERWQKIAKEAAQQSKRSIIPQVASPLKARDIANELEKFDLVILAYEDEKRCSIKEILRKWHTESEKLKNIAIVIGPEGGLDDAEVKMLVDAGAHSASLGKSILRTETAGLAAIAMVMYELEM